jgi:hypothetical protein
MVKMVPVEPAARPTKARTPAKVLVSPKESERIT